MNSIRLLGSVAIISMTVGAFFLGSTTAIAQENLCQNQFVEVRQDCGTPAGGNRPPECNSAFQELKACIRVECSETGNPCESQLNDVKKECVTQPEDNSSDCAGALKTLNDCVNEECI